MSLKEYKEGQSFSGVVGRTMLHNKISPSLVLCLSVWVVLVSTILPSSKGRTALSLSPTDSINLVETCRCVGVVGRH